MSLKDEEPPATSFVNPRKTGWLYKHGGSGVSSHWRKRWFVADSNYLFYYKTPSDKKPVGLLCLQDYASCSKAKDCKKPYSFALDRGDAQGIPDHDNGKNYLLYTDSEKDMMEWIKAMTEEMKGSTRQSSERTQHLAEKVDQKALEEISKTAAEGPKLVHLTTDRPKFKNRRPPLKKYTTFHEDDSKEDMSEDDSPAASRKKPDSLVRQQPSGMQKQTFSIEDEELSKEPSGSPGHKHKQPLLPKGGSKIGIKPSEDIEAAKVKPLPLPPKKAQSQFLENKKIPTEGESFSGQEGELEVSTQTEFKCKPLPPQPPSKKIDSAVSAEGQIGADNKPPTGVSVIAEVDMSVTATVSKPLPPSPKKKDTLILIDDQPHTFDDSSNEPPGVGKTFGHEASLIDENKLKNEDYIPEERTRESSSTSEELAMCQSDDSHTGSTASFAGKPDEVGNVASETGNKPKPKPRKRVGKEQQAAADQHEVLSLSLHEDTESSAMAAEATEAPLVDPDQSKATPMKLSEIAGVPESKNQVSNGSKETADAASSEQLAEVNLPCPIDSPPTLEGSVPNSTVSLNQESVFSSVQEVCSELSSAEKCETVTLIHNEGEGEVSPLLQESVASNLDLMLQEQLTATSHDPVITDKEKDMERVYDAVVRSDSNEVSSNPLERDVLGYTVIRKDAKGAMQPSMPDIAEHTSSEVPKSALTEDERAPRVREPYRMYETVDIIPPHKPQSPSIVVPETVPLALKQAKEVLRLAQAMRAEAEEMRKEIQRELELAKRERYDAEILKKNATEILKMAKEKLLSIQQ